MDSELRSSCDQLGLNSTVHFLGVVATPEYLRCCDCVVVCSRLDGRPNIVMESLAMGVPVVASRVGGIPQMAPEGHGICLCEPENVEQFSHALDKLASDPAAYRRLAEAARGRAQAQFSIAAAGQSYAGLFRSLIAEDATSSKPMPLQQALIRSGVRGFSEPPSRAFNAHLRFAKSLLSPNNAPGNLRTLFGYIKLRSEPEQVRQLSRFFDEQFYLKTSPDAAVLKISPLWHYLLCGFRQDRNPSPLFNTAYYLAIHRDVANAGINPLLHYITSGRHERRKCLPDHEMS
jgi:hypothetical protein